MAKLQNSVEFINKRYNRVVVIGDLGRINNTRMVSGRCDCGVERSFCLSSLKHGITKSCGCLDREKILERITKHGFSNHPLYMVWTSIKQRCYNKNDYSYSNYGGRGVRMCDEWKDDFVSFYKWGIENGWQKGLDLDKDIKTENSSGILYSPEFCSFVERGKNLRSKRNNRYLEYQGQRKCVAEWCDVLGIKRRTVDARLRIGMAIERVFSPVKLKNK